MQHRNERVYLETSRHRISGLLTLARDGYRSRVSDLLNASERDFISLTDCVVELIGHDGPGTRHDFIAVSRRHIVFAIPESGDGPAESAPGAPPDAAGSGPSPPPDAAGSGPSGPADAAGSGPSGPADTA